MGQIIRNRCAVDAPSDTRPVSPPPPLGSLRPDLGPHLSGIYPVSIRRPIDMRGSRWLPWPGLASYLAWAKDLII